MADNHFNTPEEVWKAIPGFEGYEVSDHGRVRSYWRQVPNPGYHGCKSILFETPQRIVKQGIGSGYLAVTMFKSDNRHRHLVHRLVLLAFIGPCPPRMQCCHGDGIRTNNFLYNLRWDTASNNALEKRKHGTVPNRKGTNHPMAKLNDEQVIQIRTLYSHGCTQTELANMFGIHQQNISDIVRRIRWAHI